ncbi:S66 family peptidase [Falsibacillus pallidus]|uniref:Muramoyltetrapeptide carboxypeptidase LdcA involved in peptidoglycan recycling n=1 Tax=Falsibacillus pallidus TaxID=493781 RepID=A0A370GP94_9BACI|nr:S66 peptidase family protein [Falsibacillus pallidus]RDI45565.1 muramoyltetrapeptide carboxypeptidase LdcA involved in peptidoglycan recycling [Falsibacillus pallidus]
MLKANVLKRGDTVGIITPSAPAPVLFKERYRRGIKQLENMGLKVIEGSCSKEIQSYRSSSIRARAEEINELIYNDDVKAIISTIGGSNSNSLLPYIDYGYLIKKPKIIMGYSDVTALLLGIYTKTGLATFYGPAVVPSFGEFHEMLPKGKEFFENIVMLKKRAPYELEVPSEWTEEMIDWNSQDREKKMVLNEGWKTIRGGNSTGVLIGGNLNTMSGFIGSEYFPRLKGAILFIEDSFKDMAIQERSLSMLKVNGIFDEIAGLIIGKHEHFNDLDSPFTFEELLIEVIGEINIPILANVDIGHTFPSHVFPIGIKATLDATKGTITFLEDGVEG